MNEAGHLASHHVKLPIGEEDVVPLDHIATDLVGMRILFVNVFGLSHPDGSWTLIDAGLPLSAGRIRAWAASAFGNAPSALVLTHGHFDHVGAARELAEGWEIPVYAHPLEFPFLNGTQAYPAPDPSVGGGAMAWLSGLYPKAPIDLGSRLRPLPNDGPFDLMPGWRVIHTPGHTVGHISFFREADRTLLVGDAFCTVQSESLLAIARQTPELHGPPAYYTPDWAAAKASIDKLAALEPDRLAPGHGRPLAGRDLAGQLARLSRRFEQLAIPAHAH